MTQINSYSILKPLEYEKEYKRVKINHIPQKEIVINEKLKCFSHWKNINDSIIYYSDNHNNLIRSKSLLLGSFLGIGSEGFAYELKNMSNYIIKFFYSIDNKTYEILKKFYYNNYKFYTTIKNIIYNICIPLSKTTCKHCNKDLFLKSNKNDDLVNCVFNVAIITKKCYSLTTKISHLYNFVKVNHSLNKIYNKFLEMCNLYPDEIKYLDLKIASSNSNVMINKIKDEYILCITDHGNVPISSLTKKENEDKYSCPLYCIFPPDKYYLKLSQIIKYSCIIATIQFLLIIYTDYYKKSDIEIKKTLCHYDVFSNIFLSNNNSHNYQTYFSEFNNIIMELNIFNLNTNELKIWNDESIQFIKYLRDPTLIHE